MRSRLPALLLLSATLLAAAPARADQLRHCAESAPLDAVQQDRLFRFAALVREVLDASGQPLALIARAGLDLRRFGERYSHAGISLRESPNTPWSVRQLYHDCTLHKPRLFDQGLPGFLLGGADPAQGHTVLLLLPAEAARTLEAAALDPRRALGLLGGQYSANAHAFGTRYQNCNQWLAELLALAWAGPVAADSAAVAPATPGAGPAAAADPAAVVRARTQAQRWLQQQGYQPARMAVRNPFVALAALTMPWIHTDDHPADAVAAQQFAVSMPSSIEAFVRRQWPATRRVELCHDRARMVVREGWQPLADGCLPAPGDRVLALPAAPPGKPPGPGA